MKRKREQGKRWFTKPERLDRRNENGAKLQQDPRFFSPLEHTGVSSEVRHFSLELGFPVFWPPQNVHPAVAGTPHLSRKKSPLSRKEKKTHKRAASQDQTKTGRRPDKDRTTTKTRTRQRPDHDGTRTRRRPDHDQDRTRTRPNTTGHDTNATRTRPEHNPNTTRTRQRGRLTLSPLFILFDNANNVRGCLWKTEMISSSLRSLLSGVPVALFLPSSSYLKRYTR